MTTKEEFGIMALLFLERFTVLGNNLLKAKGLKERPTPKMSMDLRSGGTGGWACYSDWAIELNKAMHLGNSEANLEETIGHEVAHLFSYALHGSAGTGHGLYWREVMVAFGLPPVRCHKMDTAPAMLAVYGLYFEYQCSCRIYKGSKRFHNSCKANGLRTCKHCRSVFKFNRVVHA